MASITNTLSPTTAPPEATGSHHQPPTHLTESAKEAVQSSLGETAFSLLPNVLEETPTSLQQRRQVSLPLALNLEKVKKQGAVEASRNVIGGPDLAAPQETEKPKGPYFTFPEAPHSKPAILKATPATAEQAAQEIEKLVHNAHTDKHTAVDTKNLAGLQSLLGEDFNVLLQPYYESSIDVYLLEGLEHAYHTLNTTAQPALAKAHESLTAFAKKAVYQSVYKAELAQLLQQAGLTNREITERLQPFATERLSLPVVLEELLPTLKPVYQPVLQSLESRGWGALVSKAEIHTQLSLALPSKQQQQAFPEEDTALGWSEILTQFEKQQNAELIARVNALPESPWAPYSKLGEHLHTQKEWTKQGIEEHLHASGLHEKEVARILQQAPAKASALIWQAVLLPQIQAEIPVQKEAEAQFQSYTELQCSAQDPFVKKEEAIAYLSTIFPKTEAERLLSNFDSEFHSQWLEKTVLPQLKTVSLHQSLQASLKATLPPAHVDLLIPPPTQELSLQQATALLFQADTYRKIIQASETLNEVDSSNASQFLLEISQQLRDYRLQSLGSRGNLQAVQDQLQSQITLPTQAQAQQSVVELQRIASGAKRVVVDASELANVEKILGSSASALLTPLKQDFDAYFVEDLQLLQGQLQQLTLPSEPATVNPEERTLPVRTQLQQHGFTHLTLQAVLTKENTQTSAQARLTEFQRAAYPNFTKLVTEMTDVSNPLPLQDSVALLKKLAATTRRLGGKKDNTPANVVNRLNGKSIDRNTFTPASAADIQNRFRNVMTHVSTLDQATAKSVVRNQILPTLTESCKACTSSTASALRSLENNLVTGTEAEKIPHRIAGATFSEMDRRLEQTIGQKYTNRMSILPEYKEEMRHYVDTALRGAWSGYSYRTPDYLMRKHMGYLNGQADGSAPLWQREAEANLTRLYAPEYTQQLLQTTQKELQKTLFSPNAEDSERERVIGQVSAQIEKTLTKLERTPGNKALVADLKTAGYNQMMGTTENKDPTYWTGTDTLSADIVKGIAYKLLEGNQVSPAFTMIWLEQQSILNVRNLPDQARAMMHPASAQFKLDIGELV